MAETSLPILKRAGLAAAVLFSLGGNLYAADNLNALEGSWTGGGTIQMTSGANERLRCKADYAVSGGGASATQTLRCASDSYRVDITSNVGVNGSNVIGNWSETTRGVSGQINGTIKGSDITATIAGPGFGAGLSIATKGSSQTINIRVNGGDVQSVSLNLKKG